MSQELLDAFAETLTSGLVNRSITSCLRWAEKRRIMGGSFPGPYRTKYHPWCAELHDSKAQSNTIMKAAQMGLSELVVNIALFTIDIKKADTLYVLPTLAAASDFSKARFNTALDNSPYLNKLFTNSSAIGLKQAGGVNLYVRGSGGRTSLKSVPASVLILDEVDEMNPEAIYLALERLSGQLEKTIISLSTPSIPNRGIHKLYLNGTQEHFVFPCPHCGKQIELLWPDSFKVFGDSVSDPECAKSHLVCTECKKELNHEAKPDFLAKAFWNRTEDADDHRSFYINQLYSMTISPKELAAAYHRGEGDDAACVEFFNSKLGLPFVPEGGIVTDSQITQAIRDYSKESVRPEAAGRLITMGVDQGKWNHVVVIEWFIKEYTNDLNVAAFAKVLWEGKRPGDAFNYLDDLMREWQVMQCVIDADPQINDARRFARRYPGYVSLCRYRSGCAAREIKPSEDNGVEQVTVDRTNWLDASIGRFHREKIELPRDTSTEFKDHIKNLTRTYKKDQNDNPTAIYINAGADHFAHALNYAEIALPLAAAREMSCDIGRFL